MICSNSLYMATSAKAASPKKTNTRSAPIDPTLDIAPQLRKAPCCLGFSLMSFPMTRAASPPVIIARIPIAGMSVMRTLSNERIQIAPIVAIGLRQSSTTLWRIFLCLAREASALILPASASRWLMYPMTSPRVIIDRENTSFCMTTSLSTYIYFV